MSATCTGTFLLDGLDTGRTLPSKDILCSKHRSSEHRAAPGGGIGSGRGQKGPCCIPACGEFKVDVALGLFVAWSEQPNAVGDNWLSGVSCSDNLMFGPPSGPQLVCFEQKSPRGGARIASFDSLDILRASSARLPIESRSRIASEIVEHLLSLAEVMEPLLTLALEEDLHTEEVLLFAPFAEIQRRNARQVRLETPQIMHRV